MKRAAAPLLTVALMAAAGCQTMQQPSAATPPAPETRVEITDELYLEVSPGSLEEALLAVALQDGLQPVYRAEPMYFKHSGAVTGTPVEIIRKLAAEMPVRVYRDGQRLVVEQAWIVHAGRDLKTQLKLWDDASLWSTVWQTRKNQNIDAQAIFYGTFDEAVEQLFQALKAAGSELEPEFYPNNTVVIR